MNASLIIPTYNRVQFINRILKSIELNNTSRLNEIIIVDSNSSDGTEEVIMSYAGKTPKIIHVNIDNSVSKKRNKGIQLASSECLIFIDDDCIPSSNFFEIHINNCQKNIKTINCGNVFFEDTSIKSSNYIRYRNSRHIPYLCSNDGEKYLNFKSIVTMNMCMRKSEIIDNNLYFDESFLGYGMEDNELGFRAEKLGFKIIANTASIFHIENKSSFEYGKKIYHTARDGVKRIENTHPGIINKLNYSFYFEEKYVHNKFQEFYLGIFRVLFILRIAKILLQILNKVDHINLFYFRFLYSYVFATYYLYGIKDRDKSFDNLSQVSSNWYDENI